MIVCNKCGVPIAEPVIEEADPSPAQQKPGTKAAKASAPKEEAPPVRPSLVKLPCGFGDSSTKLVLKDFDLCPACMGVLKKKINQVRFEFAKDLTTEGVWVPNELNVDRDNYICSRCGSFNSEKTRFCPWCASKMREKD